MNEFTRTHLKCYFYLDSFSHGEIVPFSSLKVAVQPNFENLKQGSRVLAKIKKNDDDVQAMCHIIHETENYIYFRY